MRLGCVASTEQKPTYLSTLMTNLRQDAVEIWNAGVDAVRAAALIHREVTVERELLMIGSHQWNRCDFDRIIVVGAGKAGTAMTTGLLESLCDWLPVTGWVNVPQGTEVTAPQGTEVTAPQGTEVTNAEDGQPPNGLVRLHAARPAGVNEPTTQGVFGTEQIIEMVSHAGPRDLCIALISGGGSALLPAPVSGVTLSDKLEVTRFLSAAGADITELNTVRKHLSSIKGGGLLAACQAGEMITLVLSDVLGDPLDLIASGPTVIDSSTSTQALQTLQQYDPDRTLPDSVYETLDQQSHAEPDSVAGCPHTSIVIGNNALAVDEAGIVAEQRGYNHVMQSARQCEGAAEDVGQRLAEMTVHMLRADPATHRNDCLITGGEPTVKLAPVAIRGLGGRNQQLVLSAYRALLQCGLSNREWERLCLLSGGTDGEDGPTDAAGAILDAEVHQKASKQALNVDDFLQRNDAYRFFEQAGGLLKTGPTGTNVCDVRVVVIAPSP
mgnify:CR=1 FL=1